MAKPCIRILRALLQPGAPRQPQGRLPHALPTLAAAPPCRRPAHLSRARGEPCARFLVIARGVAEEPRPTDARCRAALPASGATSRARGEPRARFWFLRRCAAPAGFARRGSTKPSSASARAGASSAAARQVPGSVPTVSPARCAERVAAFAVLGQCWRDARRAASRPVSHLGRCLPSQRAAHSHRSTARRRGCPPSLARKTQGFQLGPRDSL
ncbi:unnamed protein product, partial [Prorocentrum cordatum]